RSPWMRSSMKLSKSGQTSPIPGTLSNINMRVVDFPRFPGRVCDEHGVWDSLPCPWPGCSHGIEEDCFQQRPLIGPGTPTTFVRREWRSSDQGVYYSWEGDG